MHIIKIDNRYVFKTKSLDLNCYSVNSTVWKYLDKLFLKLLWLNTETLTLKNNICFIETNINNHLEKERILIRKGSLGKKTV